MVKVDVLKSGHSTFFFSTRQPNRPVCGSAVDDDDPNGGKTPANSKTETKTDNDAGTDAAETSPQTTKLEGGA